MSRKNLSGLRVCPFCGGKPELKKEARHFSASSMNVSGVKFYIRCEKCHARTPTHKVMNAVINAWCLGFIFRLEKKFAASGRRFV